MIVSSTLSRSIDIVRLIAITGGIGSGKSVVAHIVRVMGYEVYDCDTRAKELMTVDTDVKRQLIDIFGQEAYQEDGTINRAHMSAVAFTDNQALARLNAIVHPATARDLLRWSQNQGNNGATVAFVETALLRTSGLDQVVDDVWHVTAPEEVRIKRVMTRNGFTRQQVQSRIESQAIEDIVAPGEHAIINDGQQAVLPQVLRLLTRPIKDKTK